MKRYGLVLLVVLIATASLLAAAAYNTASIVNAATMKVVNTNGALLALSPNTGVGYKDATAYIEDGALKFDFARGTGNHPYWLPVGTRYGFQPGSTYTWDKLFKVTNNSNDNVVFYIDQTGLTHITVELVNVAGADFRNGVVFINDGVNAGTAICGGLAKGDTGLIRVSFSIPADETVPQDLSGTLTVHAKAKDSIWRHGPNTW